MLENKKYKVLVVDDSAFMRRLIKDILSKEPSLEVVDVAFNGRMAIRKLKEHKPDVITLDVEMPFMNGLETLEEIQKIAPTPVIMCSSLTREGTEVTINALELGAFDFIQKPDIEAGATIDTLEKELPAKVIAAAESRKVKAVKKEFVRKVTSIPRRAGLKEKVLVIGSSTGGPQALKQVVPYLPKDLPASILVVQHMPPKFTEMFAERLNKLSELEVVEAKEGDYMNPGKALLAPGNFHMTVDENGRISLNQEPPVWGVRPAVDITLASAAKNFGDKVVSVILTGMGHDGRDGATAVRKFGGFSIAEDESSCVVYGMPKSVIEAGQADVIAPVDDVADEIIKAVNR